MADQLRRLAHAMVHHLIGDIPTIPGYYSRLDHLDGLPHRTTGRTTP